jgi:hypothetical protein
MGPTGCTAAPHLRPLCTYHTCKINSLGCDPADPEWTTTYFDVRDRIEEIEESLFDGSNDTKWILLNEVTLITLTIWSADIIVIRHKSHFGLWLRRLSLRNKFPNMTKK